MSAYWLRTVGNAESRLADRWVEETTRPLRSAGFPRRPRIAPGDRLVLYAAGWRRIFGVVEATGEPEHRDHPRWPWTIAVEPLLIVPVLDAAPPIEAMGVAARSMSQQSHIGITPDHYARAVDAIASIARGYPPAP